MTNQITRAELIDMIRTKASVCSYDDAGKFFREKFGKIVGERAHRAFMQAEETGPRVTLSDGMSSFYETRFDAALAALAALAGAADSAPWKPKVGDSVRLKNGRAPSQLVGVTLMVNRISDERPDYCYCWGPGRSNGPWGCAFDALELVESPEPAPAPTAPKADPYQDKARARILAAVDALGELHCHTSSPLAEVVEMAEKRFADVEAKLAERAERLLELRTAIDEARPPTGS